MKKETLEKLETTGNKCVYFVTPEDTLEQVAGLM